MATPFKLKCKGKKTIKVSLPSSWAEVTHAQHFAIGKEKSGNINRILYILSGLSAGVWAEVHESQILTLSPFLDWCLTPPTSKGEEVPAFIFINKVPVEVPKKLQLLSWAQKITAQKLMTNKSIDDFFLDLLALYLWQPYSGEAKFNQSNANDFRLILTNHSYLGLLVIFDAFYKNMEDILKRDVKFLKVEPNPDQQKAGIDKVTELGLIGILDPMSKGDPLKYDALLDLPYEQVFNKLVYDNRVSKFQKKYAEVLNKKTEKK